MEGTPPAATGRVFQQAVERAEAYLRTRPDSPVSVSELCRVVGVTERRLREAFQRERGMSPKRYMLAERLGAVRRALCDRAARPGSVTEIALDHGFYELGRFAGWYRRVYGETPSATLRGGSHMTHGGHRRSPTNVATSR